MDNKRDSSVLVQCILNIQDQGSHHTRILTLIFSARSEVLYFSIDTGSQADRGLFADIFRTTTLVQVTVCL